ncbi:MAG: exonuclease domain-containing protein [Acidimicrobiales bacterium]|jgi:DNA polymerase-3 subunit epsilon
MTWIEGPLVGFDLETTGVNPCSDLPVQVALVRCERDGSVDRKVFIVDPGRDIPAGAQAIHGISTERAQREGCSLKQAAEITHRVLEESQADQVPVVAMNASFDITIAATLFRHFGLAPFPWVALVDPLVIDRRLDPYRPGKRRLDDLCKFYGVECGGFHDAGNDADATLELTRAIAQRYPEIAEHDIGDLTKLQADWHRIWAVGYDSWCRDQGRLGLGKDEFCWPVREVPAQ